MHVFKAEQVLNNLSALEQAATTEPVLITVGGEPAFVLTTIADYVRLLEREKREGEIVSFSDEVARFLIRIADDPASFTPLENYKVISNATA